MQHRIAERLSGSGKRSLRNVSELDAARIGTLIDTDACISYASKRYPKIRLATKSWAIVKYLFEEYGENYYQRQKSEKNKASYWDYKVGDEYYYTWAIGKQESVRAALENAIDYIVVKRNNADIALEALDNLVNKTSNWKAKAEEIAERGKEANHVVYEEIDLKTVQRGDRDFSTLTDLEAARLAMLIDAEGSVTYSGTSPIVVIAMTCPYLIVWLLETFGGSQSTYRTKYSRKLMYRWSLKNKEDYPKIRALHKRILDFYILKKEQAQIHLQLLEYTHDATKLCAKLHELNENLYELLDPCNLQGVLSKEQARKLHNYIETHLPERLVKTEFRKKQS